VEGLRRVPICHVIIQRYKPWSSWMPISRDTNWTAKLSIWLFINTVITIINVSSSNSSSSSSSSSSSGSNSSRRRRLGC
jgi:hypothetical protein